MEVSWAEFSSLAPCESVVLTCLADHADPGCNATAAAAGSLRRVRLKYHACSTRSLDERLLSSPLPAFGKVLHVETNTAAIRIADNSCSCRRDLQRLEPQPVCSISQARNVALSDHEDKSPAAHACAGGKPTRSNIPMTSTKFYESPFLVYVRSALICFHMFSPCASQLCRQR